MAFRDNAGISLVALRVTAVKVVNGLAESLYKCRDLLTLNKYIVGCNAYLIDEGISKTNIHTNTIFFSGYLTHLASIIEFAKSNTVGDHLHVNIWCNDGRSVGSFRVIR